MANTVDVTGTIKDQFDLPIPGAKCTVELDRTDVDQGYVSPVYTTAITDELGQFTMALWPNQRGARSSKYKFTAQHPVTGKILVKTTFVVPFENSTGDPVTTVNIFEVAELEAYEGKSDAQVALEVLQAEAGAAHTARAVAETKADEAAASAVAADASATLAGNYQLGMQSYVDETAANAAEALSTITTIRADKNAAEASAAAAATSETNAAASESIVVSNASAAASSETASATSESNALASEQKAKKWADNNENIAVETGLYSAKHHAIKASASGTYANAQANAASASATTATTKATEASTSAATASTKATEASTSAQAAASSATSASTSASTATTKANAASTSATNAAASATASNNSAISSSTSASESASSATDSASSAAAAANSAATASTQAGIATTQATNAAGSAVESASSALASSESATDSANSAAEAQATLDEFKGQYHGAQASAPTLNVSVGDLYFNTVEKLMLVYDGSAWKATTSLVNGTTNRESFTATEGQTVFSTNGNYDSGFADVYLNGVKLVNGVDVDVTSGVGFTLIVGATAGDNVDFIGYGAFVIADHYTKTETDNIVANIDALPDQTGNADKYLRTDGTDATWQDVGAIGGVFYENDQVVTTSYTITSGKNAMSAGDITIADGVTVTIPTGSNWSIV